MSQTIYTSVRYSFLNFFRTGNLHNSFLNLFTYIGIDLIEQQNHSHHLKSWDFFYDFSQFLGAKKNIVCGLHIFECCLLRFLLFSFVCDVLKAVYEAQIHTHTHKQRHTCTQLKRTYFTLCLYTIFKLLFTCVLPLLTFRFME